MAGSLEDKGTTILVVDDAEVVLNVVVSILEAANFNVLQANSGREALEVSANYTGKIHLLLTDVQMPGMNGPALGEALRNSRPDMHVMLMSAFAGGDLLVLNYGWAFIEKPFVPVKLLEMVNAVLHTPDKSQGSHQYDTRITSGLE
jgi:two-component system cell cycle sensor histidine kinase/response regulator CckA